MQAGIRKILLNISSGSQKQSFFKWFHARLYTPFVFINLNIQNLYSNQASKLTGHALLKLTWDVTDGVDSEKLTVATFMDLIKAFECVNHEVFIAKFRHYEISSIE